MKRNLFMIMCAILLITAGLSAREKTEKIGDFNWFTERNTWDEILKAAQKVDKPILAVFSADWLDTSQGLIDNVFKTHDFKRVADQVILFFIEQASQDGEAYCRKFNVRVFPTFKLFSKEGIMLDNGTFKRTVDGFLGWIKEVKSGNNSYELSKKLEKNPNDREILVKMAERMGMSDKKDKLVFLKKAIELNPDFKDEISHRAYEKMAFALLENIPRMRGREEYIKEYGKLFQDIVNAYYPGKFKYALKGKDGLAAIFDWNIQCGNNDKVISIFNDFLKQKGNKPDLIKDMDVIGWSISAYLNSGNLAEAEKWITKARKFLKPSETLKKDPIFLYYYPAMYRNIIFYLENLQKTKEAEAYAVLFYDEMSRMGLENEKLTVMQEYSDKYKTLADKAKK
jgi:hypothetical protein